MIVSALLSLVTSMRSKLYVLGFGQVTQSLLHHRHALKHSP